MFRWTRSVWISLSKSEMHRIANAADQRPTWRNRPLIVFQMYVDQFIVHSTSSRFNLGGIPDSAITKGGRPPTDPTRRDATWWLAMQWAYRRLSLIAEATVGRDNKSAKCKSWTSWPRWCGVIVWSCVAIVCENWGVSTVGWRCHRGVCPTFMPLCGARLKRKDNTLDRRSHCFPS